MTRAIIAQKVNESFFLFFKNNPIPSQYVTKDILLAMTRIIVGYLLFFVYFGSFFVALLSIVFLLNEPLLWSLGITIAVSVISGSIILLRKPKGITQKPFIVASTLNVVLYSLYQLEMLNKTQHAYIEGLRLAPAAFMSLGILFFPALVFLAIWIGIILLYGKNFLHTFNKFYLIIEYLLGLITIFIISFSLTTFGPILFTNQSTLIFDLGFNTLIILGVLRSILWR